MRAHRILLPFLALLAAQGCGGGSGRPTGPPAPVLDTIRTYVGHVAYAVTGPRITARDAHGRHVPDPGFVVPTVPRAAPRLVVEILSPTGALLGSTFTDANGDYSITINLGKNPATQVRARATATAVLSGGTTMRVLRARGATGPYEIVSPLTGDPLDPIVEIDLTASFESGAGAFHIVDTLFEGLSAIRGGVTAPMPDLDIFWEPGNGAESRFAVAGPDLGELTVAGGVSGDPASNQDVWDEPKLMRLLGEYYLAFFSHTVAPPGDANGALLVPSAAWREGFLDFWACAARGTPEYWDTEGIGVDGRVVAFFNVESFFDPALPPVGPDDPNVYQDPALVGIGSRFTVAEVLWDMMDSGSLDSDRDPISIPMFITLGYLETIRPGDSYPYLYTALDAHVATLALAPVQADALLSLPEDHDLDYPPAGEQVWPMPFTDPARADDLIVPPYDRTLSDRVDNVNPDPLNEEIGLQSQRYFSVALGSTATLVAIATSAASLRVELLDLENNVLFAGGPAFTAPSLPGGRYVVRVLPAGGPVSADFDLRIQLVP